MADTNAAVISPGISPAETYAADLRALIREFAGTYTIAVIRGQLYAWRHDGTTRTAGPAADAAGLRAAILENQRRRPRIPHPRSAP